MKYRILRKVFLAVGDLFFLLSSLYISLLVRWNSIISSRVYIYFLKQFIWLFLFWLFLSFVFDFYSLKFRSTSFVFFRHFFIFIFLILFSGIVYFYLFPNVIITPKTILFLDIVFFSIFFFLWRLFIELVFKRGITNESIVLWGDFPERKYLIDFIEKSKIFYKIIGVFNENISVQNIKSAIKKKHHRVDRIIISPGVKDFHQLFFSFGNIKVESFADFYERITKRVPLSSLEDPNILDEFFWVEDKIYSVSKRVFDVSFSFVGTLALVILFPLIALLIKIDSKGPIFFIQKRIGKNNKPFRSFKFRSMQAEQKNKSINVLIKNGHKEIKEHITFAGKILRFTHLDELPQFLNILKGDMSLVGPRPEWEDLVEKYEKAIPFYFLRNKVKPGFTGWAQINFPPTLSIKDTSEKFQYDLFYIKNRSFLFDLAIFLKSLRKIFG
jgi:lipopolysaccharide/colanic/teichoic acid biosynthesis glycosyltransferase